MQNKELSSKIVHVAEPAIFFAAGSALIHILMPTPWLESALYSLIIIGAFGVFESIATLLVGLAKSIKHMKPNKQYAKLEKIEEKEN